MEQPVVDSNCSRRFRKTNTGTLRWVSTTFERDRGQKKKIRYKQQNADSGIVVDCCSAVHVHGWLEFPGWKHVTPLETFSRAY